MTRSFIKSAMLAALLFACAPGVHAQTGPVVKPASLSFAYELNSKTLPASTSIAVTLTGTYASLPVKVVSSNDWLIVVCDKGYAPIKCTVSVLVTGLTPGTYPATITVDTTPTHGAVTVPVVLSISNPAASLLISSPSPYFTPATSAANASMSFAYTTAASATDPGMIEFDVASSGDSIPFDVTATSGSGSSAGWLRVSLKPTNPPAPVLHTSATVLIAGSVAVYVSVDPTIVASLDVGSYAATISVVDSNNSKDAKTLLVNLVITAGRPVLRTTSPHPIWPYAVIANPTADPVIAIYGDNFFLTSVVNVQDNATTLLLPVKSQTLLSRQVLQVVVPKEYFTRSSGLPVYPATWDWTLSVTNPDQPPVLTTLSITDPSMPTISTVVNAASFQAAARQTGANADPIKTAGVSTVVCPLEIISIFGQNMGPADVTVTTATGTPLAFPKVATGANGSTIQVMFVIPAVAPNPAVVIYAPIIMTSANQINAIVPEGVNAQLNGTLNIYVVTTPASGLALTSSAWPALVLPSDPGQFTFGGLGQGQAAVLNYDSSGATSINSSKNGAIRGQPISIYATGLGDIVSGATVGDGEITTSAIRLVDTTTRVEIDGQPVVVTYAGTSPGSVAGLTQINAIVPPTVTAGKSVPVTVSIGDVNTRRKSQLNVIIYIGK